MRICIGEGDEIVFGVVGIRCRVVHRVSDAGHPISIIVGVSRGLVILIRH